YMMAIPAVLEDVPRDHPHRDTILHIFRTTIDALGRVQDPATGVWDQIIDRPDGAGNYLETSASCMFMYGIAKGAGNVYLAAHYRDIDGRAYQGIIEDFVEVDAQGLVKLHGICSVAGLGGNRYRDGSFAYYVGEKVATNDYKGVGAFILAGVAMDDL